MHRRLSVPHYGLPALCRFPREPLDLEAQAEHIMRWAVYRGIAEHLRTKSKLISWCVVQLAVTRPGWIDARSFAWLAGEVQPPVLTAWRRLTASGLIHYTKRQPLRVTHA